MDNQDLMKKIAFGALAGAVGTLVIRGARSANDKLFPNATAPINADPGARIIEKIESVLPQQIKEKLPASLEEVGSKFLSFGYGSTGAAIYTAVRSQPQILVDGAALGAAIWAAGYMGWLPAMGLMPPVTHHKPKQVISSLMQHMLYGVATVSAYRKLRSAMGEAVSA
jgi:hypothetical protein